MVNPIDELKTVVANQKTIRTSRLGPLIKEFEKMYIQQGKKIRKQNARIQELNNKSS